MRKIIYIRYYKFNKIRWGSLKGASNYYLSIKFFNRLELNFRLGTQDGGFSVRNEELHCYILRKKSGIFFK